ncbi:MAG: DUF2541 family protein [Saprospiraceae bacterium]|nr:DUF2541 family protein [Saprospiraceae bacterium]
MQLKTWALIVIGLISINTAFAQRGKVLSNEDWKVLGSKQVDWKVDKDVLLVGAYEGEINKLKIRVTGGTVNIINMVVTYANGVEDDIPMRHIFKKGATSREIDLRGGDRIIKKITFVYERANIPNRAQVWVGGK